MLNWVMFLLLGGIWGSSFLLIKIGVQELDALPLVSLRLSIAALAFAVTLIALRKRLPTEPRKLAGLVLVGLLNTALPFVLITWGEKYIDSAIAGVLNGTTPLFSFVIAHLALRDDKLNLGRILGLVTGFAGIILLATRSVESGKPNTLEGQMAVLAAAACYGLSAVLIRRLLYGTETLIVSGFTQIIGALAVVTFTLLTVRPLPNLAELSSGVILALVVLGMVNTYIAYTIYFRLVRVWGARATMVTYIAPPVSVTLGVLFGNELLDWKLLAGAFLILLGVVTANFLRLPARTARPAA